MMSRLKAIIAKRDKNVIQSILWIAVAMNFLFFVYGSLEMYFLNRVDLIFGVSQVLLTIILIFVIALVVTMLFFGALWLVNERFAVFASVGYMALYIMTYIQGTFLVKYLPVLTGEIIDWDSNLGGGRTQSIILALVVCVLVVVLFVVLKQNNFYAVCRFVCGVMVLMLMVTAFTLNLQTKDLVREEVCATFEGEFEFSDDTNFIILLLDAVNSEVANSLIEEYPEYQEMFDGFTFYRNTVGSYPSTSYALSYLFSGEWFENEEPYEEYRMRAYEESPLFNYFEENDYQMELYTAEVPSNHKMVDRFANVYDVKRRLTNFTGAAQCMVKFAGFRYGLYDLKKFFNFNLFECYNYYTPKGYDPYSMGNDGLYASLANSDFTTKDGKRFKFIHIEGAHVPWTLNKEVQQISTFDVGGGTYEDSVAASLTVTKRFLENLKKSELYDNSVVVVMADHGYNSGLEEDGVLRHYMPFLCIKGAGERHDFRISDAPVSAEDFIPAFEKLAEGSKSDQVFDCKEGDERARRFMMFLYGDLEHIYEYSINGHVYDTSKFQETGNTFFSK